MYKNTPYKDWTSDDIISALKDENSWVRRHAIEHLNATPEHISQALKDKDWSVRWRAIQHPNATPEHISQALKDEDWDVRERAQIVWNQFNALQKLKFRYKDKA